jgi:hypothetical protein
MTKTSSPTKWWQVSLWSLNLILLFVWLGLSYVTKQEVIAWRQAESSKNQTSISDNIALKHFIDQTPADRSQVENLIVNSDTVTNFIDRLDSLAKASRAQLKIEQANVVPDQGLGVQLVVTGDFDAVYRYLQILNNLPEAFVIKHISLTTSQANADYVVTNSKNTGNWRAVIEANLLSYQN